MKQQRPRNVFRWIFIVYSNHLALRALPESRGVIANRSGTEVKQSPESSEDCFVRLFCLIFIGNLPRNDAQGSKAPHTYPESKTSNPTSFRVLRYARQVQLPVRS